MVVGRSEYMGYFMLNCGGRLINKRMWGVVDIFRLCVR
jgi:hypothetical protein